MDKLKNTLIGKAGILGMLAFVLVMLSSWITLDSLPKSFAKKINKAVVELWGDGVELKNYTLKQPQKESFQKVGVEGVFEVRNSQNLLGYVVLAKARSKFENFEYVVYYDQNKTIKAVRILLYREDYGGEIASKRWLRQFDGKTSQSPITIDNDIQGISGATISYLAITKGVKNITQLMSSL